MYRIDSPGSSAGAWVDRDPVGGIPGTQFVAAFENEVQEEIIAVIAGAGIALAKGTRTQLRDAIKRLHGGFVTSVNFAASPFALALAHAGMVIIDASGGNVVLNLPAANVLPSAKFIFIRSDASGNTVTVNRAGADTLDAGLTSFTLTGQGDSREIVSDGVSVWRSRTPKGVAFGYAPLDGNQQVPSANLPPAAVFHPAVRQTVLSAAVDANGYANFLTTSADFTANLLATAVPVLLAFAAGFNVSGALDFVIQIAADVANAWAGLTATTTNFLYIDRNAGTGAITYGASILVPVYSFAPPGAPANGQHWFDLSGVTMKVWNGAGWDVKQRVFVGEAVTDGTHVTSLVSYALRGRYDSGWIATLFSNTIVTKSHNIGVVPDVTEIWVKCTTLQTGFSVGDIFRPAWASADLTPFTPYLTRNGISYMLTANSWIAQRPDNFVATALTAGSWSYRYTAERGW